MVFLPAVLPTQYSYKCRSASEKGRPREEPPLFEVDEVDAAFKWRSVVVKGPFHVMKQIAAPDHDPTDTSLIEDPAFAQGVALLRSVFPETFDVSDPTPFRSTIFRIHLDEVTGREAAPVQKKKPKQS